MIDILSDGYQHTNNSLIGTTYADMFQGRSRDGKRGSTNHVEAHLGEHQVT